MYYTIYSYYQLLCQHRLLVFLIKNTIFGYSLKKITYFNDRCNLLPTNNHAFSRTSESEGYNKYLKQIIVLQ